LGWEIKVPTARHRSCPPESTTQPLPSPPLFFAAAAVSTYFTSFSTLLHSIPSIPSLLNSLPSPPLPPSLPLLRVAACLPPPLFVFTSHPSTSSLPFALAWTFGCCIDKCFSVGSFHSFFRRPSTPHDDFEHPLQSHQLHIGCDQRVPLRSSTPPALPSPLPLPHEHPSELPCGRLLCFLGSPHVT
ncbi:hypothetical protein TSMEX_011550, partial [Taenia solium]